MPNIDGTKSGGRQKGTLNKRTLEFASVLKEHNFCPASAMIDVYNRAIEAFELADTKEAPAYLSTASSMASGLASYAYPKLKSIDYSKSHDLAGMTAEQRLEAMRHAVRMLELQVNEEVKNGKDKGNKESEEILQSSINGP